MNQTTNNNTILKFIFFVCFAGIVIYLFANKGNLYAVVTGLGLFITLIAFTITASIKGFAQIISGFFMIAGLFVAFLGYSSTKGFTLSNGMKPVALLLCFVMIFPILGIYGFLTYLRELTGFLTRCKTEVEAKVLSSGFRFDRDADRFIEAHRGSGVFMTMYKYKYDEILYETVLPSFTPSKTDNNAVLHINANNPDECYSSKYLIYEIGTVISYLIMFVVGILASAFIVNYLGF